MRLIAALLLTSTLACTAADEIAGRWEGSIQIPGRECALIVDLERADGKDWAGSFIIPGLGVKGAPLSEIAVQDSEVGFTIKGALASERIGSAKFQGHLAGADRMGGDFLQAGNAAPFTLKKTGPPQTERPRPSTPVSKDFEGEWKGEYEMNGYPRHVTLTLANHPPGGATAQLVIVGKKTNNAPIDLVTEEKGFLTLQSPEFGITYEGRLGQEAREIKGTFTLGPFELPLLLRRSP